MLSNDFWHGFFIGDLFVLFVAFMKQRLFPGRAHADSSVIKRQQ